MEPYDSYRAVYDTAAQILRELSYRFREALVALRANESGSPFAREFEKMIERLLFTPLTEAPLSEMTIQGSSDPRRDLILETFIGIGVHKDTAENYTASLMESRAQFDDEGNRLPIDPAWRNITHWRARMSRWWPVIFAAARKTYTVVDDIYRDASQPFRGTPSDPQRGIGQIVDLLRRFPDIAPRVYQIVGFTDIAGFPPARVSGAPAPGIDAQSRFIEDVQSELDSEWWLNMAATAGLVVISVVVTVFSAGTLGPAAAAVIGAGLGTAHGGMLVLNRASAVSEGRVAVTIGAMSEETLAGLERDLDGAWAMLAVDVVTGGVLGRFGGGSLIGSTLRAGGISAAGGGLGAAVDPQVWDSEDRVALIFLGVVIGGVAGAGGAALGAGATEYLARNLRVQLAAQREGGPIRPGRVVRLSVGRNAEPVDATVLDVRPYARQIVVNVRGRNYTIEVERTIDIRRHTRRTGPAEPNRWGRDFEITPLQPTRAPRAPTSALTESAREALTRPNTLLMRAYSGSAPGAMTNATSGRSWWRRVPIEEARPIIEGFRSGRIGPDVEHALLRYGFRPSADPNHAEIWMTDLHSLVSRNPGARFEIDGLGDVIITTPRPDTLLNSVRRFRLSRRNPVEHYYDAFSL